MVALRGREEGYKPYKLMAKEIKRFIELHRKYGVRYEQNIERV